MQGLTTCRQPLPGRLTVTLSEYRRNRSDNGGNEIVAEFGDPLFQPPEARYVIYAVRYAERIEAQEGGLPAVGETFGTVTR